MPTELNIALKEWAVVCAALEQGRQIMLLRKGGIQEWAGGFEISHRQFLLFPSYLHQNATMLKPPFNQNLPAYTQEPPQITITAAGEITDILRIHQRSQIDALDDQHIWTAPLIDMRFNYRPENPLYLLLVRAYVLPEPVTIGNTPAYAGCKSWVPLSTPVPTTGLGPALPDEQWHSRRRQILETWPA